MELGKNRRGTRAMITAAVVFGLVATACGSTKGSAKTTSASTASPASSGGTNGTLGPLAAATADFAQLSAPPKGANIPTTKLAKLPSPSTRIYIIGPLQIPTAKFFATEFTKAMNVMGVTNIRQFSFTPGTDELTARMDQAVTDKPDGLFLIGAAEQVVAQQLDTLQKNGTKIVTSGSRTKDDPVQGYNGYDANVVIGQDAVAAIAATLGPKNPKMHIGHVVFKELPVFVTAQNDGIQKGIQRYCPTSCVSTDLQLTLQDQFSGQLPSKVASFMQSHRDINALFFQAGNATVGVTDALKTAGITNVMVFGQTGDARNWQAVKDGAEAGIIQQSLSLVSWRSADLMARLLQGVNDPQAEADNNPLQWLTAATVPNPKTATDFVPFPDFESQFKTVWGVK